MCYLNWIKLDHCGLKNMYFCTTNHYACLEFWFSD